MKSYKTSKELFNELVAGGYKFKHRLENGKDVYMSDSGEVAIVDFNKLNVERKDIINNF